jgi:hypothetical protein
MICAVDLWKSTFRQVAACGFAVMEKGMENRVSHTFYAQPKTGVCYAQSTFPQAPQRLLL